ncbi:MAG TPA: DUF1295 domain-containing protein [Acidobacteriota bacterium]|nr:DUF1295 domain-containing protein [Acidobacteriota bacterium]
MLSWTLMLQGWGVIALAMLALWIWQRRSGDAGIVDVGWTFALGFLAVFYASLGSGDPQRRLLLGLLVGAWSLRLGLYLLFDRVLSGQEDGRYQQIRENWGDKVQPFFLVFFQAQGALAVLLALPFAVVAVNPDPLSLWDGLAVVVMAASIGGETLADRQLARWRRDPSTRGRTCRQGLWRYSRHPNYFFEWLHWWAYPLMAAGQAYFWVTLLSPLLMLFFILKVTGIPPTEERALKSRGEDYRRYQRTTSAFVPWFPKEEAAQDTGKEPS